MQRNSLSPREVERDAKMAIERSRQIGESRRREGRGTKRTGETSGEKQGENCTGDERRSARPWRAMSSQFSRVPSRERLKRLPRLRERNGQTRGGEARRRGDRAAGILLRDDYVISRNDPVTREERYAHTRCVFTHVHARVTFILPLPRVCKIESRGYSAVPTTRTGGWIGYVPARHNCCVLARGSLSFDQSSAVDRSQLAAAPRGTPRMRID